MSIRRSGHSRAWVPHITSTDILHPSRNRAIVEAIECRCLYHDGAGSLQEPSSEQHALCTESRARKHDNNNGVAWKHVLHGRTSITVERGAHKEFPRRLGARPSTDDHVHGSACTSIGHEHMDQIRSKIRSGGERRERYKFVKDSVMCLSTLEYLLDRVLTVGPGLNF